MYTIKELKERTKVSDITVYRWANKLVDTHMVLRGDNKTLYHDDFLTFIQTRATQGPSNLPSPERIAKLYELKSLSIEEIAIELGEDEFIVGLQMEQIGLGV
jgi:hypothetical protein